MMPLPFLPLLLTAACKVVAYANLRFFYPMELYLASDWSLTATQMSTVIAAAEFSAISVVLISPLLDTYSPQPFVAISLVLVALSSLIPPLFSPQPSYAVLLISRIVYGSCLAVFDVSAQTALLAMCQPADRDRATGILEWSWSLSIFTLVPVLSALTAIAWPLPFYFLFVTTLSFALALAWVLRRVPPPPPPDSSARRGLACGLVYSTGALSFNFSALFFALAHNTILSLFSLMLDTSFHLSPDEAGQTQLVIGLAEFAGALLVIVLANSHPSNLFALSSVTFCFAILVFGLVGNTGLAGALFGLLLVYVPGEFGVILRLARASTFANPADANAILAVASLFLFLGRACGPLIAVPLFDIGFGETVFVASSASLLAWALIYHAESLNPPSCSP